MTDTAPPYAALDERLIDLVHTPNDLTRLHPVQLAPELETVIHDLGFTPSDQQRRALQMAWDFVLNGPTQARYLGIWGYAGVGKSTVIQLLIKGLKRRSHRCTVAMCAPTNKAVKVLRMMAKRSGLFGITFGTIHSMLNLKRDWDEHGKEIWKPKQMQKKSGQPSLDQFDLIILDEASMVGDDLWEQIQVTIAAATGDFTPQLIAMGDPAQLPPVKTSRRKSSQDPDGEPQQESPLFRDIEHSITLTQVMRYGGSIGLLATHIREHLASEQLPDLDQWLGVDQGLVLTDKYTWLEQLMEDYQRPETQEDPGRVRVLCYTNKTVQWLNAFIRHHLLGEVADLNPYVPGDRIITCAPVQEAGTKILDSRTECRITHVQEQESLPVWGRSHRYPYRHWALSVLDDQDIAKQIRVLHPCSLAEFDHDCQQLRQEALEIPTEQSDRRRAAWRKFYQHKELFAAVEYGFCLTIHSAQGSTFDRVYIPMPDIVANPRERERNQLFYTAVTRARQQVILGV